MTRRLLITAALAASVCAIVVTAAFGDGGPGPGVVLGWDGVAAANGKTRYVALPAGRDTTVAAISTRTGRVVRFNVVRGRWGVPLVAFDGSSDAISRDGKRLVLAEPAGGPVLRQASSFAILSTRALRRERIVRLRGDFAFDALSPDAATLYLIQHTSSKNLSRYVVRAYDLQAQRLLKRVIADRRSGVRGMSGYPLARAATRDGVWAYTLYRNDGSHPFIHALNTVRREAVCIDLPWHGSQDGLWKLRFTFTPDQRQLHLRARGAPPSFVVDTKTLRLIGRHRSAK